jgi:hypothetical protein
MMKYPDYSDTHGAIFMTLHRNIHYYEKLCCKHEVSRSKAKIKHRGHWKMFVRSKTSICIQGFRNYFAQCIPLWSGMSRTKFRSQRLRSRSHKGVKIQIKIWKCVWGPFSNHLLRDCNTNGHYHDYRHVICNLCQFMQGQGH